MRKANRRILSFVMAMLVLLTTVFGHVDFTAVAAEVTETVTTEQKLTEGESTETSSEGSTEDSTEASTEESTEESTEPAKTVVTIAEALAAAAGTECTVKGVVTLVDGKNIYVQDETGGICLYMSTKPSDIALGDTVVGTGAKKVYNGLPELDAATYEKSEGLVLAAKPTTLSAITESDIFPSIIKVL